MAEKTLRNPSPEHLPAKEFFRRFAAHTALAVGSPWTFLSAVLVILIWGLCGPIFHFSDTWQLIINTATTIVTFLMVFLIQNSQNRDARSIHIKLDELIRAQRGARNTLVDLENLSEEELDELEKQFKRLGERSPNPRRKQSLAHTRQAIAEEIAGRDDREEHEKTKPRGPSHTK